MSEQTDLNLILDEMEAVNVYTRDRYPELSSCLRAHMNNEVKLVKALRRAILTLTAFECWTALNDITAILQPSSEPKE